jgi:hypothetical protein
VTVRVAVCLTPRTPEIVTVRFEVTVEVFTVKVAVVRVAGIVTLEGTVAIPVLLLESVTTVPPAGAGPFRVTVPVEVPPPRTEVGLKETELRVAAVIVRPAVRVVPE